MGLSLRIAVADPGGYALTVDNLRYATVLDNQFWSATSAVFNGKISHARAAR